MLKIIEGLDRTGKSTIAEYYKNQGFEVIHLSAPDKKYKEPGYTGPSYFDDMMDLLISCLNRDVILDRSYYGELVWPQVYGRESELSLEQIGDLREFEDSLEVERILMYDSDTEAHWQRCVDNKEPLNTHQFKIAGILFEKLAEDHGFSKLTLEEFNALEKVENTDESKDEREHEASHTDSVRTGEDDVETESKTDKVVSAVEDGQQTKTDAQVRLEKANAINKILSKNIIKQKDEYTVEVESMIRSFLNDELSKLLGEPQYNIFSDKEVEVLKLFCERLASKEK